MKCNCADCGDSEMEYLTGYDTGMNGGPAYAYNLYQCKYCGSICKEDVWEHPGKTWIYEDGTIICNGIKYSIVPSK